MGGYYPALTAACSLGERILNHLILILRDDYRHTPEFKTVYRKNSFDNWDVPIDTLESWDVLLPKVAKEFRCLKDMRNKAIHFRPEVDRNDRDLALRAVKCLQAVAQIVVVNTTYSMYKNGKHNIYGVCHDGLSI